MESSMKRGWTERQLVLLERLGALYPGLAQEVREELALRGERLKLKAGEAVGV